MCQNILQLFGHNLTKCYLQCKNCSDCFFVKLISCTTIHLYFISLPGKKFVCVSLYWVFHSLSVSITATTTTEQKRHFPHTHTNKLNKKTERNYFTAKFKTQFFPSHVLLFITLLSFHSSSAEIYFITQDTLPIFYTLKCLFV